MTESKTITLPAHAARWALRAALTAASSDGITPVLCAVLWTVAGGKVSLIGTDRYSVHEAVIDAPKDAPDGEFLMHREQAKWILANAHKPARTYRDQLIRIEWVEPEKPAKPPVVGARRAPGKIAASVIASREADAPVFRYETASVSGNFPPVRNLFPVALADGDRKGEVALAPYLVARLGVLAYDRGQPLRFLMPLVDADNRGKPVVVQNFEGTARALVQPNLMLRAMPEWQGPAATEGAPR